MHMLMVWNRLTKGTGEFGILFFFLLSSFKTMVKNDVISFT